MIVSREAMKHAAENKPSRACACGGVCRANQRNCYRCHALANSIYRARVKHSAEKLRAAIFRAMADGFSIDGVAKTGH